MKSNLKKFFSPAVISAVFLVLLLGFICCWYYYIRTDYRLGVDQVLINFEYPIAGIYDWDNSFMNFLKSDSTLWTAWDDNDPDSDMVVDVIELEERMGLLEPYHYYMRNYEFDEEINDNCLDCDIVSYDRKKIVLRYHGTYFSPERVDFIDDTWELDISETRKGKKAKVYLNGAEYSA